MEREATTTRLKAVVIDDAYSRPTPEDLRTNLPSLRRFLRAVPDAKTWFDATFGLNGPISGRGYFDPLLHSAERTLELWRRRSECPESQRFADEGIPDLVAEVGPLQLPLGHVEQTLASDWDVVRFANLPDLASVPPDARLVVIDYVLTPDTPADIAARVAQSTNFLRALVARAVNAAMPLPLIVLISSRPGVVTNDADAFREAVGVHGGYFYFILKASIQQQLGVRIQGFIAEAEELESYRKVHAALQASLEEACTQLRAGVKALELQDLAALHVGHLIREGEPLGDYVAWMLGQALAGKLQRDVPLAEASGTLPPENHRVLLGHLKPTQGIPELFCDVSSVRTASGDRIRQKSGTRELRFGDIFVGRVGSKLDLSLFRLVVSQTCDLLQEKITNGQVLCVEGRGAEVNATEADLVRATLHQLDDKGSTLVRLDGDRYYQVEWDEANLISIAQAALKREQGFRYVGRLNEIYALEVQHNALNRLGRIGVPVKPGYGAVFGVFRLRVWGSKNEAVALARTFDNKTVTAVLRPLPKNQVAILLSMEVKKWLVEQLTQLRAAAHFPAELVAVVDDLVACIGADRDFRFLCNRSKKGVLQLGTYRDTMEDGKPAKKLEWLNKVSVSLGGAPLFTDIAPAQGVHVLLELDPIA